MIQIIKVGPSSKRPRGVERDQRGLGPNRVAAVLPGQEGRDGVSKVQPGPLRQLLLHQGHRRWQGPASLRVRRVQDDLRHQVRHGHGRLS